MYDAVATKMLLDLLTLIFELGDMQIKWHSVNPYTKFENPSCHYPYSSDEGLIWYRDILILVLRPICVKKTTVYF